MSFFSSTSSSVMASISSAAKTPTPALGKTMIVTGATSGVGLVAARTLAKAGATVVLAVRDVAKGSRIAAEFGDVKPGACEVMQLDLSSLESVKRFADAFKARADGGRLDVLMNNAGVFADAWRKTEDGLEDTFQVHVVAHYYLVRLLQPCLERTAAEHGEARIVWVSSEGHNAGTIKFPPEAKAADASAKRVIGFRCDGPEDIKGAAEGFAAYAQAKLCQLLVARHLSEELHAKNVLVVSLHPGAVATNIWPWYVKPVMNAVLPNSDRGAATQIFLAAAPRSAVERVGKDGKPEFEYWSPFAFSAPARAHYRRSIVHDDAVMKRLIDNVELILRERNRTW